ncbi:peptide N-acetyl-beta-D-glucosaminyl asparaginase amidase A-domain-containing protein [Pseudomassariella vexata]|uniref:Peptide N-acetyl-beta-D-glucosaminyl asparaginase amidase A-domain-containing protein n=1 Tax=Pseudomassariella vexata TaxID=1141098 RepID=A0A1Y2DXF0_9PEZI|nr:peptide N-acetyl-beta-D-glucosaminyl asparaginase amidase A-domain-containing protein [Pseudomassariella vexata]ORY63943.1 peptide N-acetyl-beta-D-glucosaminyl asparaginase amidase A-domain-containing protein [Pseudomassariella vexata]
MEVFQVEVPLRRDFAGTSCEQVIVEHTFAASYGTPYVGTYAPRENCEFNTVIFNISIKSSGINYDRLGLLFFGDIEILRTSTAMPTRTGIFWNFQKDMTIYDSLLRSEQKIIMQLDNIYDSVFTGAWDVTVTALYYNDDYDGPLTPAEIILPLSTLSSAVNSSSVFSLPNDNTTMAHTLPRNAARTVVNIVASGNGNEEFWYRHVPSEFAYTFNSTKIKDNGPFREVQLFLDGKLAGVSWPFPIVFTGGINPALWVPIVGFHSYDVPSYQIDISPWLGILCDGQPHTFSLAVAGYDSTTLLGTTNENWWISGSIFVWIDKAGNQTTAENLISTTPLPTFDLTDNTITSGVVNTSISLILNAKRHLSHSALVTTSSGTQLLTWSQELFYFNSQYWTDVTQYSSNGTLDQRTNGIETFSPLGPGASITNTFRYFISTVQNVSYPVNHDLSNSSLYGSIDHSISCGSTPILSYLTYPSVFASFNQRLATRQVGWAVEYWNNTYYQEAGAIDPAESSDGETEQWYTYSGPISDGSSDETHYSRHVKALDGYEPVLLVDD